jgi:hypothetical protein
VVEAKSFDINLGSSRTGVSVPLLRLNDGSRKRATASGDPVLGVKFPGATLHVAIGHKRP